MSKPIAGITSYSARNNIVSDSTTKNLLTEFDKVNKNRSIYNTKNSRNVYSTTHEFYDPSKQMRHSYTTNDLKQKGVNKFSTNKIRMFSTKFKTSNEPKTAKILLSDTPQSKIETSRDKFAKLHSTSSGSKYGYKRGLRLKEQTVLLAIWNSIHFPLLSDNFDSHF